MKINLTLPQKALLLVVLPLAGQLIFLGCLGYLLKQVEIEARRAERSRAIISQSTAILWLTYDACTTLVAFSITKTEMFKHGLDRRLEQIPKEVEVLRRLTSDNPEEIKSVERIQRLSEKGLSYMRQMEEKAMHEKIIVSFAAFTRFRSDIEKIVQEITAESDRLVRLEQEYSRRSPEQEARARALVEVVLVAGILANIVVAIALTIFFNRRISTRLGTLIENNLRLARGDKLKEPVGGADEIAQLDSTFRSMAQALDEANRQQRAVIENASDVICSIEQGNRFVHVNPAARVVWGYPEEELVGKRFVEIIHSEDAESTLNKFQELINSRAQGSFENRVVHKDGSLVDISWSLQWSESERSMFCVARDVSARKEAERLKQQFLEMVSHDIRTPLTSVSATLQLLELGVRTDSIERDLSVARRNIAQVVSLLNELLDIQRMESGKLPLFKEETSANDLFAQAIDVIRPYAQREKVELEAPSGDAMLLCDADRMHQVLVNLYSNAIKFSNAGMSIKSSVEEKDGWVRLSVEDQGPGVPEEFRQSIFDRFKQVRQSDETEKGGKGLGLAICKAIVEEHGGKIGVESGKGSGSIFWIMLPHADESSA